MKTNVTAVNMKLTEDVSAYLDKKLSHIEKLLTGHASDAVLNIELGRTTNHHQSGDVYEAKAQLHAMGHQHALSVTESSVFAAIDRLKDELSEELSKEKDKEITMIRRGGRAVKGLLRSLWPFGNSEVPPEVEAGM